MRMKKVAGILMAIGNVLLSIASLIGTVNNLIRVVAPKENENEA